ncbi:hypothetical protein GCM10011344_42530 [Dokdonia pacifica]|uniref:Uncharacterized protein n=1 Tax=Dokdonia pacifica TaxID=1627892 RepID=A0A239DN30_9FLAO|nr:hypothetical protein [Dokdonia pacifica]GGG37195.1 hypothetical protein GCM10011344_42530 [Dokdonia pacifica]SNS33767.1 hypothetical protein SAMN06265376_111103 [Dokdonia pacifica]
MSKIKNASDNIANRFFITEVDPTQSEFKELLEIKLGRKKKSGANRTLDLSSGNLFLENPLAQKNIFKRKRNLYRHH